MKKADHAASVYSGGYNCAQAVFSTMAPGLGLDAETAARVATAFGGGMARMGGTCGAVTGALMTIGLARGSRLPADKEAKEGTYLVALEFVKRFMERHGSITCRDLLGCDIGTHEGHDAAKAKGLFDSLCATLVRDAVTILDDMLSKK
jgi:C_GCAxxG_C_C family probable redox protein